MPGAEFVPLAALLAPPAVEPAAAEAPQPPPAALRENNGPHVPLADPIMERALREARVFRARLHDALRDAFATLLAALAAEVVGRELRSVPCDLDALMERWSARMPFVRVRVAPEDAAPAAGFAFVVDAELEPGDAILELEGGAIDARLGVRLATVLEHFA